jgi:hypothetical protein
MDTQVHYNVPSQTPSEVSPSALSQYFLFMDDEDLLDHTI